MFNVIKNKISKVLKVNFMKKNVMVRVQKTCLLVYKFQIVSNVKARFVLFKTQTILVKVGKTFIRSL